MKKKLKLKLNDLRVTSFLTSIDNKEQNELKGGTDLQTNPVMGTCGPPTNLTRCNCFYLTIANIHCELEITGPLIGCHTQDNNPC